MKIIINEVALKNIIAEEWSKSNMDWGNAAKQPVPSLNIPQNPIGDFANNARPYFQNNNIRPENYVEKNPKMSFKVSGPSEAGVSPEMLNQLSLFETGKQYGYNMGPEDLRGKKDSDGHLAFGYGLLFHPTKQVHMDEIKPQWSQKELEQLYVQSVSKIANQVRQWAAQNGVNLNQNQLDAMVSATYNFGKKFLGWGICNMIAQNPNDRNIYNVWANLSNKQGIRYPGLIDRRRKEADWYFQRA